MFSSGPNYTKLKTHLRLALNRLKLLEKKKTELSQKAQKEIADSIAGGKAERAKIRVEHIIREDYLVEAMEMIEMYCDLLLARFGLITQMKDLDDGIAEAVYSIVWVCPRLQADVSELKTISDIFISKYGKEFAERARTATGDHRVSEKLMSKLEIKAPPKILIEKYLIEIANNYAVEYQPDPEVMKEDLRPIGMMDNFLIDLGDKNNLSGGGPPQMGFIGYPQPPQLPQLPDPPMAKPFNYPGFGNNGGGSGGGGGAAAPFQYNIPPNPSGSSSYSQSSTEKKDLNINTQFINEETHTNSPAGGSGSGSPDDNQTSDQNKPKPTPRTKFPNNTGTNIYPSAPSISPATSFPDLPNVPNIMPEPPQNTSKDDDDIDFDDLTRRFEALKKKK